MASLDEILNVVIPTALICLLLAGIWFKMLVPWGVDQWLKNWWEGRDGKGGDEDQPKGDQILYE